MVKLRRATVLTFFFVFLSISVVAGLSSNDVVAATIGPLKYPALVFLSMSFLIFGKSFYVDRISLFGYFFFLFFVLLFTLISEPDSDSILVFFGYLLLLLMWFGAQSKFVVLWSYNYLYASLLFFSILHISFSFYLIFDLSSYSFGKGQFLGYLNNPNAYGGVTGLLLVFFLSSLGQRSGREFFAFSGLCFFLGVFAILSGSRATLLCVFFAFLLTNNKPLWKFTSSALGLFLAFILYVKGALSSVTGSETLNRDVFEDTGRGRILQGYLIEVYDRFLLWGTGLSESGGRIKTELAYLDLLLFSGVGFWGFLFFVLAGVFYAYKVRAYFPVLFPCMVYIGLQSFFEGYLSNVMSVLTLIFYILHGVAARLYHEPASNRQQFIREIL